MAWTPLSERLSSLPLILAGPLLRRTEPTAVTVWLALKAARTVTLRIYGRDAPGGLVPRFEGTRHTVRLGAHLHLVAITAHAAHDHEASHDDRSSRGPRRGPSHGCTPPWSGRTWARPVERNML